MQFLGTQGSLLMAYKKPTKKNESRKNKTTLGDDLEQVAQDQVIKTDPEENKRRRTLELRPKKGSLGFTLQSYGIHHLRKDEIELLTYVDYVEFDGPAYLAGLRPGDVILSINGTSMEDKTHPELVLFIKNCSGVLRMVVLFENCCRKVELHMREIKLQKILAEKCMELQSLNQLEKMILEGRSRNDPRRLSLSSSASSFSSFWDDRLSLRPELDICPSSRGVSPAWSPLDYSTPSPKDVIYRCQPPLPPRFYPNGSGRSNKSDSSFHWDLTSGSSGHNDLGCLRDRRLGSSGRRATPSPSPLISPIMEDVSELGSTNCSSWSDSSDSDNNRENLYTRGYPYNNYLPPNVIKRDEATGIEQQADLNNITNDNNSYGECNHCSFNSCATETGSQSTKGYQINSLTGTDLSLPKYSPGNPDASLDISMEYGVGIGDSSSEQVNSVYIDANNLETVNQNWNSSHQFPRNNMDISLTQNAEKPESNWLDICSGPPEKMDSSITVTETDNIFSTPLSNNLNNTGGYVNSNLYTDAMGHRDLLPLQNIRDDVRIKTCDSSSYRCSELGNRNIMNLRETDPGLLPSGATAYALVGVRDLVNLDDDEKSVPIETRSELAKCDCPNEDSGSSPFTSSHLHQSISDDELMRKYIADKTLAARTGGAYDRHSLLKHLANSNASLTDSALYNSRVNGTRTRASQAAVSHVAVSCPQRKLRSGRSTPNSITSSTSENHSYHAYSKHSSLDSSFHRPSNKQRPDHTQQNSPDRIQTKTNSPVDRKSPVGRTVLHQSDNAERPRDQHSATGFERITTEDYLQSTNTESRYQHSPREPHNLESITSAIRPDSINGNNITTTNLEPKLNTYPEAESNLSCDERTQQNGDSAPGRVNNPSEFLIRHYANPDSSYLGTFKYYMPHTAAAWRHQGHTCRYEPPVQLSEFPVDKSDPILIGYRLLDTGDLPPFISSFTHTDHQLGSDSYSDGVKPIEPAITINSNRTFTSDYSQSSTIPVKTSCSSTPSVEYAKYNIITPAIYSSKAVLEADRFTTEKSSSIKTPESIEMIDFSMTPENIGPGLNPPTKNSPNVLSYRTSPTNSIRAFNALADLPHDKLNVADDIQGILKHKSSTLTGTLITNLPIDTVPTLIYVNEQDDVTRL